MYNILSISDPAGLRTSSLEAPGLHDTNLKIRGQDLLGHVIVKECQIKIMAPTAMFTVTILQRAKFKPPNIIAHEKGFRFHAQPTTGAYSCL